MNRFCICILLMFLKIINNNGLVETHFKITYIYECSLFHKNFFSCIQLLLDSNIKSETCYKTQCDKWQTIISEIRSAMSRGQRRTTDTWRAGDVNELNFMRYSVNVRNWCHISFSLIYTFICICIEDRRDTAVMYLNATSELAGSFHTIIIYFIYLFPLKNTHHYRRIIIKVVDTIRIDIIIKWLATLFASSVSTNLMPPLDVIHGEQICLLLKELNWANLKR